MSTALKRYEIRQNQNTKRNLARWKFYSSTVRDVLDFLNCLPDEIKLAFSSEILMRSRSSTYQQTYTWKHEHERVFQLLNENIGARNNMLNTRAISNVFSVSDIAKIIEAAQPARLRPIKLKAGERVEYG